MPVDIDQALRGRGTKFRLFPQADYPHTETVWVSSPAGSIQPGPADARMVVVDPFHKTPYDDNYLPPYRGPTYPPVRAGADGHFDHLEPGDRDFLAAHMYGTVRRVLDIWEGYFGTQIAWHFSTDYDRLELIPILSWDNAHSGYGFIETGMRFNNDGQRQLFCLNFDVLAHELGHSLFYAVVGIPEPAALTAEYRGFHEAASDLVALLAVLHFDSVIDRLLDQSRGNLYTLNELNRIGELSADEQIRLVSNDLRMCDVEEAWHVNAIRCDEHKLSLPLTGAVFDILVEVFQEKLLERAILSQELVELVQQFPDFPYEEGRVQQLFDQAYSGQESLFRDALLEARDYLGYCLAWSWQRLDSAYLSYQDFAALLLAADSELNAGRYHRIVRDCLAWRDIHPLVHPMISQPLAQRLYTPRQPFQQQWQGRVG